MKFLIDVCLPTTLAELLNNVGHDAVDARHIGLQRASDPTIMRRALDEDRILVSADTDFGTLLARSGDDAPSVILIRRGQGRRAEALATSLASTVDRVADDLSRGAVVVIEDERIRIRRLPILPAK